MKASRLRKTVCKKCKKNILDQVYLQCQDCQKTYHGACINKKIDLIESKNKWRCTECTKKHLNTKNDNRQPCNNPASFSSTNCSPCPSPGPMNGKSLPSAECTACETSADPAAILSQPSTPSRHASSTRNANVEWRSSITPTLTGPVTELSTKKMNSNIITVADYPRKKATDTDHAECSTSTSEVYTGATSTSPSPTIHCQQTSIDNVTRRKQVPVKNQDLVADLSNSDSRADFFSTSLSSESDESCSIDNLQNRSLPDLRNLTDEILKDYESKLINLETRLQSAENEIQNLICENGTLKKRLEEKEQTIKGLVRICSTPPRTPKNKTERKRLTKIQSPQKQLFDTGNLDSVKYKTIISKAKTRHSSLCDGNSSEKPNGDALNYNKPNESMEPITNLWEPTIYRRIRSVKQQESNEINRLCIVSTPSGRAGTKVLTAMLENFDSFHCIHYATPGGGIPELLKNLPMKVKGYTKNDCGILMIGEKDFKSTENFDHISLVKEIICAVEALTFTNIVVCTPTYICGAPIFNYRVELFNTCLNEALQTSNSVHFYDSNLNLELDMFSLGSGKLLPKGMRNILKNVGIMMCNFIQCAGPPLNINISINNSQCCSQILSTDNDIVDNSSFLYQNHSVTFQA